MLNRLYQSIADSVRAGVRAIIGDAIQAGIADALNDYTPTLREPYRIDAPILLIDQKPKRR